VEKKDAIAQTGLELQIMYACDLLMKELKVSTTLRESLFQRMADEKHIVGDLSKEEAAKLIKQLIDTVEKVK